MRFTANSIELFLSGVPFGSGRRLVKKEPTTYEEANLIECSNRSGKSTDPRNNDYRNNKKNKRR